MCFFDKNNNSKSYYYCFYQRNTFLSLSVMCVIWNFGPQSGLSMLSNNSLTEQTVKKTFHGYPTNGCIPRGYALQWAEVHKRYRRWVVTLTKETVSCDTDQFVVYSEVLSHTGRSVSVCSSTNSGINSMEFQSHTSCHLSKQNLQTSLAGNFISVIEKVRKFCCSISLVKSRLPVRHGKRPTDTD